MQIVRKFYTKYHWHLTILLFLVSVAFVCVALGSFLLINPNKKYTITLPTNEHSEEGLVLGAGVNSEGQPYDELKARLDRAAEALSVGTVNKLILSGDNRFVNYNEPEAMKRYLMEQKGVEADRLILDYAGRSTYESCERAAKIFQVKKLIIFSAGSHLPRAVYICRHFGIESFGVASGLEANNSTRRELLARIKAVYNIYLFGEKTILGDPMPIEPEQIN